MGRGTVLCIYWALNPHNVGRRWAYSPVDTILAFHVNVLLSACCSQMINPLLAWDIVGVPRQVTMLPDIRSLEIYVMLLGLCELSWGTRM